MDELNGLDILTYFVWLISAVTFIIALKFLASPRTARTGNLLGAAGMALVVASDSHANMYGAVGAVGTPVVVSEAVRLAKTYSTERSGAFVNGVLPNRRKILPMY